MRPQGFKVGQTVEWKHPHGKKAIFGRVSKISDTFLTVKDRDGWEQILPAWVVR